MAKTPKAWWRESDCIDFAAQEEIYKAKTGDRHYFLGFNRRFETWLEKNPRHTLAQKGKGE